MPMGTSQSPLVRGNLLPQLPLAAAVARRAGQVCDLLRQRRKVAMAYRRAKREDQRIALAQIDCALAQFNIDLPAIQRLVNKAQTR